jgi:hypothetical protein
MQTLYTATATAKGGRQGHVRSEDGVLDLPLALPKELGGPEGRRPILSSCLPPAMRRASRMRCFAWRGSARRRFGSLPSPPASASAGKRTGIFASRSICASRCLGASGRKSRRSLGSRMRRFARTRALRAGILRCGLAWSHRIRMGVGPRARVLEQLVVESCRLFLPARRYSVSDAGGWFQILPHSPEWSGREPYATAPHSITPADPPRLIAGPPPG